MKKYLTDLTERVLLSGALAFMSTANLSDLSTFRSGLVAAGAAIAQLIVGLASQRVGDPSKAGVTK